MYDFFMDCQYSQVLLGNTTVKQMIRKRKEVEIKEHSTSDLLNFYFHYISKSQLCRDLGPIKQRLSSSILHLGHDVINTNSTRQIDVREVSGPCEGDLNNLGSKNY